jgi:signal transduction histidine kinase
MFFRANESSQGNGLGLYVVQKAIEQLNGSIRFESEVGKGSTFWVRIPIKDK